MKHFHDLYIIRNLAIFSGQMYDRKKKKNIKKILFLLLSLSHATNLILISENIFVTARNAVNRISVCFVIVFLIFFRAQ